MFRAPTGEPDWYLEQLVAYVLRRHQWDGQDVTVLNQIIHENIRWIWHKWMEGNGVRVSIRFALERRGHALLVRVVPVLVPGERSLN